jgi:hypothetical protein
LSQFAGKKAGRSLSPPYISRAPELSRGGLDVLAMRRRPRVEALDCGTACRRNPLLVGDQAATDALTVWDELPANREGVCHTGLLVALGIGSDNGWGERHAKRHERKYDVGLHNLSKMHPSLVLDAKQMKKLRESSGQL